MSRILSHEQLLKKVQRLEDANRKLRQNEARPESLLTLSRFSGVTVDEIREFALESIVSLTDSKAGYLHFVNEDKGTIELVSWSKSVLKMCQAEKVKDYSLDSAGIWADSIRLKKPVVQNDYQNEPDRRGCPAGHFEVIRHLSVPIFDQGKIVAVAGVGNKTSDYNESDVNQTMLFMDNMWTILQQKNAEELLRRYSNEDGLTTLANRRRFDEAIDLEWRRALRNQYSISVILIDIDHFKAFNDTYGHQSGDACLRTIGKQLKTTIMRAGELVARYGGEEFVIILPNVNADSAMKMAERIREQIRDLEIPHASSETDIFVTISAGVASVIPDRTANQDALMKVADIELYTAKRRGRNRVCGYIPQKIIAP